MLVASSDYVLGGDRVCTAQGMSRPAPGQRRHLAAGSRARRRRRHNATRPPGSPIPCSPFPDSSGFGSNPAYYETLRTTTNLFGSRDTVGYVLGRLPDGLHAYALRDFYPDGRDPVPGWDGGYLPVLTDLADPSGGLPPASAWSTIRTGDIDGDGATEVLAIQDGQLRAWHIGPQGTWNELPATPPLNLGATFTGDPSYYSTLEVGPVAPGLPRRGDRSRPVRRPDVVLQRQWQRRLERPQAAGPELLYADSPAGRLRRGRSSTTRRAART